MGANTVLDSVNFGCFAPSRCQRFYGNAMRKANKAHKNWLTIQQNEHTLVARTLFRDRFGSRRLGE